MDDTERKNRSKDPSQAYNFHLRKDQMIREYHISLESMKMLREELSECVRSESVNQFVNCKELREKYFLLCQDNYRGMIMPPGMENVNRQVPGLLPPKK
mmetsp:Transcript_20200/g.40721  ORF Transcript_20200/g.40721 Transcript_20200/m.40721 type:complete len:99 (+) Transcript_20200:36-332(+)|eukprot:CAMPEP_0170369142 /NCGR_PEP_ID=MMETSP0117_2-20130122/7826_1 /TAXON_ID=400756 /ORGANISM="Durinskia baltica, Strain CSIRO CS-38" /LENGTH=98 /DNA_ID=CAMNT_0010623843 /DNA_START=25 /DNA_END=321 /DNA_ORIENTATION=-